MAKEEDITAIIQACPMNGGDDAYSYSQYSVYQKRVVDTVKQVTQEAIKHELDLNSLFPLPSHPPNNHHYSLTFRIADFGCATGPATFVAVHNIMEAVLDLITKNSEDSRKVLLPLEFQVFFNDQTDNDFNALFRSLPPATAIQESRHYFAAGVPGSFYDRLFPKASLHVGCISFSLHWLSRVPAQCSKGSANYTIQCTGYDEQVVKAYYGQFKKDMVAFFDARAEEIVAGGLLAISALCLPEGVVLSQTGIGAIFDLVGTSLMDVAKLGHISEEDLESFYLPIYYPRAEELEASITEKGYFSIKKIVKMSPNPTHESKELIKVLVLGTRSVLEKLIIKHFQLTSTSQTVDLIFERLAEKISANISVIAGSTASQHLEVFILAKRL